MKTTLPWSLVALCGVVAGWVWWNGGPGTKPSPIHYSAIVEENWSNAIKLKVVSSNELRWPVTHQQMERLVEVGLARWCLTNPIPEIH